MSDDIYREILLEHARHPKRVGEMLDAHARGECSNPMCGDRVAVSLLIESDKIKSLKILPSGCSISTASASLMSEFVEGKSLHATAELITHINDTFTMKNAANEWPVALEILSPLKRIRENPLKIPCVLISWIALSNALKNYNESTAS